MYTPMLEKADYSQRIQRMAEKLNKEQLDAVIIFANEAEPANVRYFSNYRPIFETTAVVISRSGKAVILTGPETEELVKQHSVLQEHKKLIEFRETSDPDYPDIAIDTFGEVFEQLDPDVEMKNIGLIGTNLMTVQVYEGILEALSGKAVFSKADHLLRELRMIKSDKELAILKKCAEIAGKGFEYALNKIEPGMTEIQVAAKCMEGVYQFGAEGTGFPIWCLSGAGTNQAIGIPTQKPIEKHEVIQISMGAMLEGYVSSFGRPFVIGTVSDEVREMMEIALQANALTHEQIKPGVPADQIANTVYQDIKKKQYGDCVVYGPAHGIGMMECEYPFIERTSNIQLQESMTFAVDTFLASKHFGMRFEDTAAVTKNGEEQYCSYRREIIQL